MTDVAACPVCHGQGTVSKPPWVAGDQDVWSGTNTALYPCRTCKGQGFLVLAELGEVPKDGV